MADPGTWFYLAMASAAAGTAVSTADQISANKARQRVLEQELRANELRALDEENERLRALQYANDDMVVNAGGIDAWASPSLIAAREFNFKMGMEDIQNLKYNIMADRAGISARIATLKRNSRATLTSGMFQIASYAFAAGYRGSMLKKAPTDQSSFGMKKVVE